MARYSVPNKDAFQAYVSGGEAARKNEAASTNPYTDRLAHAAWIKGYDNYKKSKNSIKKAA